MAYDPAFVAVCNDRRGEVMRARIRARLNRGTVALPAVVGPLGSGPTAYYSEFFSDLASGRWGPSYVPYFDDGQPWTPAPEIVANVGSAGELTPGGHPAFLHSQSYPTNANMGRMHLDLGHWPGTEGDPEDLEHSIVSRFTWARLSTVAKKGSSPCSSFGLFWLDAEAYAGGNIVDALSWAGNGIYLSSYQTACGGTVTWNADGTVAGISSLVQPGTGNYGAGFEDLGNGYVRLWVWNLLVWSDPDLHDLATKYRHALGLAPAEGFRSPLEEAHQSTIFAEVHLELFGSRPANVDRKLLPGTRPATSPGAPGTYPTSVGTGRKIWLAHSGDDGNGGLSLGDAVRTPAQAIALAQTGDTINVVADRPWEGEAFGAVLGTGGVFRGTSWDDPGLVIQGVDETGAPALATLAVPPGAFTWVTLQIGADQVGPGWWIFRNIVMDCSRGYASTSAMILVVLHGANAGPVKLQNCMDIGASRGRWPGSSSATRPRTFIQASQAAADYSEQNVVEYCYCQNSPYVLDLWVAAKVLLKHCVVVLDPHGVLQDTYANFVYFAPGVSPDCVEMDGCTFFCRYYASTRIQAIRGWPLYFDAAGTATVAVAKLRDCLLYYEEQLATYMARFDGALYCDRGAAVGVGDSDIGHNLWAIGPGILPAAQWLTNGLYGQPWRSLAEGAAVDDVMATDERIDQAAWAGVFEMGDDLYWAPLGVPMPIPNLLPLVGSAASASGGQVGALVAGTGTGVEPGEMITLAPPEHILELNPVVRKREQSYGVVRSQNWMAKLSNVGLTLQDLALTECWCALEIGFLQAAEWALGAQGRIHKATPEAGATFVLDVYDPLQDVLDWELPRDVRLQPAAWAGTVQVVAKAKNSRSYENDWDEDDVDEGVEVLAAGAAELTDGTWTIEFTSPTEFKVTAEDGTEHMGFAIGADATIQSPTAQDMLRIRSAGWNQQAGSYATGDQFVFYTARARTAAELTPLQTIIDLIRGTEWLGLQVYDVIGGAYYASPLADEAAWEAAVADYIGTSIAGFWEKGTRLADLIQPLLKLIHASIYPTPTGQLGLWRLRPAVVTPEEINGDPAAGGVDILDGRAPLTSEEQYNVVEVLYLAPGGAEASYPKRAESTTLPKDKKLEIDLTPWEVDAASIRYCAELALARFSSARREVELETTRRGIVVDMGAPLSVTEPLLGMAGALVDVGEISAEPLEQRAAVRGWRELEAYEDYWQLGIDALGVDTRLW